MAKLLRTEVVAYDDVDGRLVDYPGNARIHDDEALDGTVAGLGQFRNVLARELPDGRLQLLAGHGTKDALLRAGKAVEVEVRDVPDDDEARDIVAADNGTSRRATFDDVKLLALLKASEAAGTLARTSYASTDVEDLERLLDGPPSLDDLEKEHGEPDEKDLWPVLKLPVPPEVRDRFETLMRHPSFEAWDEPHERFAALLVAAGRGLG